MVSSTYHNLEAFSCVLLTWNPCIHSTVVQSDTSLLVERYAADVLGTDELGVGKTSLFSA